MRFEIVIDAGETPNKCTIAPLSDRPDFRLFRVRGDGPLGPLTAPILLHPEGECLASLRNQISPAPGVLAAIDCIWRRLPRILARTQWREGQALPVLAKIPQGFHTAYPRVSYQTKDPDGGLATIEAIFIAAALLGHWDPSLLAKYYFARAFLDRNRERFLQLGVGQAAHCLELPEVTGPSRTAWRRRLNRGRGPKIG